MAVNVENGFRQTGGIVNAPFANGKNIVTNVEFVVEPGTPNQVLIRCNFRDGNDDVIQRMSTTDIWLSPNDSGFFLIPYEPTGAVFVVGSEGAIVTQYVTKKYFKCVTSASGTILFKVDDTAKNAFYFVVSDPQNVGTTISRQILPSDYGI